MDNAVDISKYLTRNDLIKTHQKCDSEALTKFTRIPKLSTTELSVEFYNNNNNP